MACKSWYPSGTLRWRENGGRAGVGTGRAAAVALRVVARLAAGVARVLAGCWWLPADAGISLWDASPYASLAPGP
jgi:hypothetical protein